MSEIKLTEEQQSAVDRRNSSVLVSAAAGSGKTRVLTERLMAYVTDAQNPADIDSFLVITYTRAAAAELRARILAELSRRSGLEPENRRLRRQSALCYNAQIGTIHSFCTSLIRENCHRLSLGPDFRVGDEDNCALLREKALEKVLDSAYENMDSTEGFSELVGSVGAGQDDSRLASSILELYTKVQSHPYPSDWAQKQIELLSCDGIDDIAQCAWGEELMERARESVNYWYSRLSALWYKVCENETDNEPLIKAYGDSITETLTQMQALSRALNRAWDEAYSCLPIEFPRLGSLRNFPFEETQMELKSTRENCKKAMESLATIFDSPSAKLISQQKITAPAMAALLRLTLEFDRQYSAEKRRQNILDFSDLEHFAVALLYDRDSGCPSEVAEEISQRYTEIMVDEYQDVNEVQDLIFRSISRDGKNIFMVGDVKQSVYRFRLADPSIFIEKYHSYKDLLEAAEAESTRILLRSNFRSDRAVLDACNHVFSEIMSEKLGDIDYDDNARLRAPDDATEARGEVKLTVLEVPQADDAEERPDKTALEASMVARQIKQLVESGTKILDKGEERPVRYGDIALLLMSPKGAGGIYSRAFAEYGIPIFSEKGAGFFSSPEIVLMIAFLTVVDNPHRDIPLTAVLSSPMFGFSADELTQIRLSDRSCDFYSALIERAETDAKCRSFIETLNEARALSHDISVRELINHIYDRLELPALWTAAGGGSNLMLLSDLAQQFEGNGYRGLHKFLEQLKLMEQRGLEPQSGADSPENCVSIMSIHKSKGLEFPVVFLADCARKFNMLDLSRPVLAHPKLGVGGKLTDLERGIEFPTIAHRAIKSRLMTEILSEEMRVLYVAMTRAKERLYISCSAKDPEDRIRKLSEGLCSPIAPEMLRKYPSFADWLIMAAITDGGKTIKLATATAEDESVEERTVEENAVQELSPDDIEKLQKLREALSFRYPYTDSQALPSKLTATMLHSDEPDEDAKELVPKRERLFRLPDFSLEERMLSAAERGTATHIVMQFIDFSRSSSIDDIKSEIERIAALGQLTPAQAKAVDARAIERFFSSDTGERIRRADKVMREFRFSLLCPAEQFFPEAPDEELLLQGVVDCCIEEQGKLCIIDYKTDSVTKDTLSETADKYKPQLRAYAYAMERILKKPVSSCILCFLRSGLKYEFTS